MYCLQSSADHACIRNVEFEQRQQLFPAWNKYKNTAKYENNVFTQNNQTECFIQFNSRFWGLMLLVLIVDLHS